MERDGAWQRGHAAWAPGRGRGPDGREFGPGRLRWSSAGLQRCCSGALFHGCGCLGALHGGVQGAELGKGGATAGGSARRRTGVGMPDLRFVRELRLWRWILGLTVVMAPLLVRLGFWGYCYGGQRGCGGGGGSEVVPVVCSCTRWCRSQHEQSTMVMCTPWSPSDPIGLVSSLLNTSGVEARFAGSFWLGSLPGVYRGGEILGSGRKLVSSTGVDAGNVGACGRPFLPWRHCRRAASHH